MKRHPPGPAEQCNGGAINTTPPAIPPCRSSSMSWTTVHISLGTLGPFGDGNVAGRLGRMLGRARPHWLLAGEPCFARRVDLPHLRDPSVGHHELDDDVGELLDPEALRLPWDQRLEGLAREDDPEGTVLLQDHV